MYRYLVVVGVFITCAETLTVYIMCIMYKNMLKEHQLPSCFSFVLCLIETSVISVSRL